MAEEVVLPQWGMNMREGTLVRWLKAEGDEVNKGDPIAEIETDKIESELESPVSGVLRRVLVPEGETIPVFTTLALVGSADEELPAAAPPPGEAVAPVPASAPFPKAVLRDLKVFLRAVEYPLAVRSSGLLEDSPSQPLAGIYRTVMIPNRGITGLFAIRPAPTARSSAA